MMKQLMKVNRWKCKCEKCSYGWVTRGEELTKICPKCNSANWDVKQNGK